MERFTVSIDDQLMAAFDAFMLRKGYNNRSEAVRDLIRDHLGAERLGAPAAGECVACLSYVYDHDERQLASRLIDAQHRHHDLSRSTLHVHLDHHDCFEVTILEGAVAAVTGFAEELMAEKGVRHGRLNLVPLVATGARHSHAPHERAHVHRTPET
jgi:CopG family nickel-responsive transcriptional regulator